MRLVRSALVVVLAGVTGAGCGSGDAEQAPSDAEPAAGAAAMEEWVSETEAGTKPIKALNWNLQSEPTSVDPIKSAYYSENQVLANMCESLLRLNPDYTTSPGLAKASNPSPKKWVYDVNPEARFWNGKPVTADDVAYSLNRNVDEELGSFWSFYYRNVDNIKVSGDDQVTVTLKRPDYVFAQGMATVAGAVVEEDYVRKQGKKLGTNSGGLMCTGPFEFDSWEPGSKITLKRNADYWIEDRRAEAETLTFRFLSDENSQTNALIGGTLDGEYQVPFSALSKLENTPSGTLYKGHSLIQYNLVVTNPEGPLSDARVRRALSMAIDREGIAATAFRGAAAPARTIVSQATYGYAKDTFAEAQEGYGSTEVDIEGAKKLLAEAKPSRPVIMGYPTGGAAYEEQVALAVESAAKEIGLPFTLKGIPTATYSTLFGDPKVTEGLDLIETAWYLDVPEPLVMYQQFLPGVSLYNLSKYENDTVTRYVNEAIGTADPEERAQLVLKAEAQVQKDLPWIGVVQIANTLFMNNKVGGAPASFVQNYYPWAADIGGR